MRKQPTGEPDAGDPHVRFGGEGASAPLPNPDVDGTRLGVPVGRNQPGAGCSPPLVGGSARRPTPRFHSARIPRRLGHGRPSDGHHVVDRPESRLR